MVDATKLTGKDWSPLELRHSFVSLLSDSGVPIEDISRLVGHTNTVVTETVCRHQIRPVIMQGAAAIGKIFGDSHSLSHPDPVSKIGDGVFSQVGGTGVRTSDPSLVRSQDCSG